MMNELAPYMDIDEATIWQWLSEIPDPEIPVVSILDLGIVRAVAIIKDNNDSKIIITITPTYSGCPAMDIISMQIRMNLIGRGLKNIEIKEQLQPAWTTDWITESGKDKMEAYGIAPPRRKSSNSLELFEDDEVPCPRCKSSNTSLISRFGATSCKAFYTCNDCKEPFEHFKCH